MSTMSTMGRLSTMGAGNSLVMPNLTIPPLAGHLE